MCFCVVCNVSGNLKFVYGKLGVKNSLFPITVAVTVTYFVTIFGRFSLPHLLQQVFIAIVFRSDEHGKDEGRCWMLDVNLNYSMFVISLMKSIQHRSCIPFVVIFNYNINIHIHK